MCVVSRPFRATRSKQNRFYPDLGAIKISPLSRTRLARARRCAISEAAQRALCVKPAPRAALRKFLSESAKSLSARARRRVHLGAAQPSPRAAQT